MFRTADGINLNFVDNGGAGIPFVFQHGLGGDEKQPAEVFPSGSKYRRLTLECRGHGHSEAGPVGAFSLAQFTQDLADFIESKVTEPVVVGGISMGAAISIRLAATRPDLVKGLVLARPAWLFTETPTNMAPNAYVGSLLERSEGADALELFDASSIAREIAILSPDNLVSLRGFFARPNRSVWAALLKRISADGTGVDEKSAGGLSIPALAVGTDKDYIHPFHYAVALASTLPKGKLVKIPPKSDSREAYVQAFRQALAGFLDTFES